MKSKLSVIAALALASACSAKKGELQGGKPFVAVYQQTAEERSNGETERVTGAVSGTNDDTSFYLAIKKSELNERYFLSAYLKQLFPGAVSYGAARSLGTRVVSFKEQNGKIFVFDTDDRKTTSSTFDPEVVLDAWPIVRDRDFEARAGAKDYVLVDPAKGLNRYSVMGDYYGAAGFRFETEVAYMQRFREISDGATFEQVFTGYSDWADPDSAMLAEDNSLRASGTLGYALRKYQEGEGFAKKFVPQGKEMFFRSSISLVENEGYAVQYANHWNIKPGGKPIEWVISDKIKAYALDPRFKYVDIYGAIARGITNWNEAFGFEALTARIGEEGESFGDDDLNYLIFDQDPSNGYAFANWRENPNTGEIRGASVYFNSMWLEGGWEMFLKDVVYPEPSERAAPPATTAKPVKPMLVWDAMPNSQLCALEAPQLRDEATRHAAHRGSIARQELTPEQKFENYITHVIIHEIGHTLGLRHNFKGSLEGVSSSVMEYIVDDLAIYSDKPGPYDLAAIKYLYLGSDALPTQLFCTDHQTRRDPDCATFDVGATPLTEMWAPAYDQVFDAWLANPFTIPMRNVAMNGVLAYVRAPKSEAEQLFAWHHLSDRVRLPLSAQSTASNPNYANVADGVIAKLISRMFLDAPVQRGSISNDPILDGQFGAEVRAELEASLIDRDSVRSFPTRRLMVDVLKMFQDTESYTALLAAEAALEAKIPTLSGEEKALSQDLQSRIRAATTPYFVY